MIGQTNPEEIFEHIGQIVNYHKVSLREGMKEITDACARIWPGKPWNEVLSLDFEGDMLALTTWLEEVLTIDPPDEDIEAFWFGLTHPEKPGDEAEYRLYVSGSDAYDPMDQFGDWTSELSYLPEGRFADSKVLREIPAKVKEITTNPQEIFTSSSTLCFGYAALVIAELLRTLPSSLLLSGHRVRFAAIGLDGGSFIMLNPIRSK